MASPIVAALILARGGSRGVPGKNLAEVGGFSLVARAIRAARGAGGIEGVWVSTDDADIAAEARVHGAQVIERPSDLASDEASSEAGWLHALPTLRESLPNLSHIMALQCTSPFTTASHLEAGLVRLRATGAACVISVQEDHGFFWRDGGSGAVGVNHDPGAPRQRRQDMPPQWRESGAFYLLDLARFEPIGRRFCGPVALCPVEHPLLEIDTPQDLALARAIAGPLASPSEAALSRVRAVIMDFDGVHTDDRVFTDQEGRESVVSSRADGLGLGRLRDSRRFQLLILSKERNPVVTARAAKLQIDALQGIDNKVEALEDWLERSALDWSEVLFVGNDINDGPAMVKAGLSACPLDAHPDILALAQWCLPAPGGRGALRALSDGLLGLR